MGDNMSDTTKLTLENEHGTYTIEVKETNMDLDGVMIGLVLPILSSAGYQFDLQAIEEGEFDGKLN
jgi:hypothetical protein